MLISHVTWLPAQKRTGLGAWRTSISQHLTLSETLRLLSFELLFRGGSSIPLDSCGDWGNRCVHAGLFLLSVKFHWQSGFRRAASRRESQPQGLRGTKEQVSSVHFIQDLVLKGKPSNWPLPTNNTKGGGAQELPTRFRVSRCDESWVVKAKSPVLSRALPGRNEPWPLMTIRHLIRNCSDVTENTF